MSTTVTYKGQTLTTVENQTKTLQTAGTWVEGDFTLTDVTASGGGDELYNLINGSITDAEIDWSKVTAFRKGSFHGCTEITTVDNPVITNDICANVFSECSKLTFAEITTSMMNPQYGDASFRNCPLLEKIILHFSYQRNGSITFANWHMVAYDKVLHTVVFDIQKSDLGFTLNTSWMFHDTALLRNVVIKCQKVTTLSGGWSANAWGGIYNNPTESTIWVPSALVSDYQTATNWSALYDAGVTFAPIEGSIYE